MKHYLLVFLSLAITQIFSKKIEFIYNTDEAVDSPCTTPKGVKGTCISVFKCEKLFPLYQDSLVGTSAEKQTIEESLCGWSHGAPLVCCAAQKQCGNNPLNVQRLAGARNSSLGAWPWMAAVYVRDNDNGTTKFVCGGSLISSEWVLTAAHCIPTTLKGVSLDYVRLGDLDLDETVADGANPIEVKIKNFIKHPKYMTKPKMNDVALLHLEKPVTFSQYISPICLHSAKEYVTNDAIYHERTPTVAGWGDTAFGAHTTTHLLDVELKIVPLEECKKKYDDFIVTGQAKLDKTVLCSHAPKKDACQGDSGGPLMFVEEDGTWSQGGIVSYGYECATDYYPGVYMRVAAFTDWISRETGLKF